MSNPLGQSAADRRSSVNAPKPTTHGSQTGTQALQSAQPWASKIKAAWNKSVHSIIEAGKYLCEAQQKLDREEWKALLALLPFGRRTAERLMSIGRSTHIADNADRLPPSWRTLSELSRLPKKAFLAGIADGSISPEMERVEAVALAQKDERKKSSESSNDGQDSEQDDNEASADAASIAKSHIAKLESQLKILPPLVASEVEKIILHWLHNRIERAS